MKKNSFYSTEKNCLNPLFQQWYPRGRMQQKDMAFFIRKLSFIKRRVQDAVLPKKQAAENEDGYENDWQHAGY